MSDKTGRQEGRGEIKHRGRERAIVRVLQRETDRGKEVRIKMKELGGVMRWLRFARV